MITGTFTLRSATIIVHRATVRDRLMRDVLAFRFNAWYTDMKNTTPIEGLPVPYILEVPEEAVTYFTSTFWRMVTQSEVSGDLGYPWFAATAPMPDLMESLEGLLLSDAEDYDKWSREINIVDLNLGNVDFLMPEDEKKGDTPRKSSRRNIGKAVHENESQLMTS